MGFILKQRNFSSNASLRLRSAGAHSNFLEISLVFIDRSKVEQTFFKLYSLWRPLSGAEVSPGEYQPQDY